MNEIIFLISFSVCLLLLERRDTDFYMLILYPTTLLKVLTRFKSFLVESVVVLSIWWYHLQMGYFDFFFPYLLVFVGLLTIQSISWFFLLFYRFKILKITGTNSINKICNLILFNLVRKDLLQVVGFKSSIKKIEIMSFAGKWIQW
jgi:hypothetical protein